MQTGTLQFFTAALALHIDAQAGSNNVADPLSHKATAKD